MVHSTIFDEDITKDLDSIFPQRMHLNSQIRANRKWILLIFLTSSFLIGLLLLLRIWKDVPISYLTRDLAYTAEVPFYTGFFSQLGIFFWAGSATLCLFSAHMKWLGQIEIDPLKMFLFYSGLLSLLLAFDDIFLLHEEVFPVYFGISELIVFGIYGILVVILLVKFRLSILKTNYILLAMGFGFLGLSIVFDIFEVSVINTFLLEDGAKMTGIVSWFFYYYSNAVSTVSSLQNNIGS